MSPVNVSAIGAYIREQREQAKISLRQLAQSAGISNPYLSQIERGLRRPSADILQQIAKGLRISAEALYVQAGLLEDRPPGSVVREAVLTDEELDRAAEADADRDLRVVPQGNADEPGPDTASVIDDQTGLDPDEAGPGLAARPQPGRGHHRAGPAGPDGLAAAGDEDPRDAWSWTAGERAPTRTDFTARPDPGQPRRTLGERGR